MEKSNYSATEKIKKFLTDKDYRFLCLASRHLYDHLSDEEYLKRMFHARLGYDLNLDNPQTFNEKLQWLKLHDRKPIYTTMVDKYEAKKYVASIIGEEYIIPTLGVWDKFDDIDFEELPDKFVLKCTHDSGGLVICKDKSSFDYTAARKKINKCLAQNFYYRGREWPYKNVKPRIIAEKYMEDNQTEEIRDYKFFCFGGVAKCYKVDFDRFIRHKANYFNQEGEIMKFGEEICPPDFKKELEIPKELDLLKELASKLSVTHAFIRTDFYDINGNVYFGELTFYPSSGFGKFIIRDNDELFGKWIRLPEIIGGVCLDI